MRNEFLPEEEVASCAKLGGLALVGESRWNLIWVTKIARVLNSLLNFLGRWSRSNLISVKLGDLRQDRIGPKSNIVQLYVLILA